VIWLNLVTNGIQDVASHLKAGEGSDVCVPAPAQPTEFNRRMVERPSFREGPSALLPAVLGHSYRGQGWRSLSAGTCSSCSRPLCERAVFNCRSESVSAFRIPLRRNPFLIFGVAGALLLHVACMYIPAMQQVLRIQPVEPVTFVFLVLLATSVLWVMEGYKLVTAKNAP
jgi:hypothetical protein